MAETTKIVLEAKEVKNGSRGNQRINSVVRFTRKSCSNPVTVNKKPLKLFS